MNKLLKVTIPAAGKSIPVTAKGKSIYFLQGGGGWNSVDQAATVTFDDQGIHFPAFAGNIWPYSECLFNKITIHGTAETAGGTLYFQTLPTCEPAKLNFTQTAGESVAGTTNDTARAASNTPQTFSLLNIENNGNAPKRAYIWVVNGATKGINYAFNADPSQGVGAADCMQHDNDQSNTTGSDRVSLEPLEIVGIDWILAFRYVATVSGETPDVIVTFEY